jgi:hypothetical protein
MHVDQAIILNIIIAVVAGLLGVVAYFLKCIHGTIKDHASILVEITGEMKVFRTQIGYFQETSAAFERDNAAKRAEMAQNISLVRSRQDYIVNKLQVLYTLAEVHGWKVGEIELPRAETK